VFNATFNNISAISWRLVLVVEEAGVQERTTDHGQVTGTVKYQQFSEKCQMFYNSGNFSFLYASFLIAECQI
jgi:hypothetical protein